MYPQQVFPRSIIAVEAQALRNLIAGEDLALDGLVALVRSLADAPILAARLIKVRCKLVCFARFE